MKNETNEKANGINIGSRIIDIITVGLLFAAYSVVYYAGFILKSEEFSLGWIALVSLVGLTALFAIGTCSCIVSKVRANSLTIGFLTFSAVQLIALIGNYTLMGSLLLKMSTVDSIVVRTAYIIEVAVILVGYIVDVFSFDDTKVFEDDDEEYDEEYDEDEYEDAEEEEIEEESDEATNEEADDAE